MAGGLFNRVKTWVFEEVLKSKDVNAEFDNILNHLSPQFIASFSQTIAQMQTQLDPGAIGTEVLASSTAEEIEQIRFSIARIMGLPLWYQSPPLSLTDINSLLSLSIGIPNNRLISGRVRSSSNQAMFLVPDGTIAQVNVKALLPTNPNLSLFIQSQKVLVDQDLSLSGLSLAPGVSNTATIADVALNGDESSKTAGEFDGVRKFLIISGAGTNIVSEVGQWAAFSLFNGVDTEYFLAYVKSATLLTNVMRGFFFNNLDAPVPRITVNNGDVITLLKLTWVFVKSDLTMDAVYNTPIWSATQPTSPTPGDFWFNLNTQVWNKFSGAIWVNSNSTLVGYCAQDTAATIAARSLEYFAVYDSLNTLLPATQDVDSVMSITQDSRISVAGIVYGYWKTFPSWNMTLDLDTGLVRTATTAYYLYVTELGKFVISDIRPYDREFDFKGKYHPYNTWRCVGVVFNTAGNVLDTTQPAVVNYTPKVSEVLTGTIIMYPDNNFAGYLLCDGSAVSRTTYADLWGVCGAGFGVGDGSTTFNLPNLSGRVPVGAGGSLGVAGTYGGALSHTLSLSEMPSHQHTQGHPSANVGGNYPFGNSLGTYSEDAYTFTAVTGSNPPLTSAEGGGAAHSIVQSYMAINFLIKT